MPSLLNQLGWLTLSFNQFIAHMARSLFNPDKQVNHIPSKIVVGLERISEVFKVLLWEKAKILKLSPIQIQLLNFIAFHHIDLCNVSHLAKEFNVTKPTISDAVRVLANKGLIEKEYSQDDNRRYAIRLSEQGNTVLSETEDFANPLLKQLKALNQNEQADLFSSLSKLIYQLNQTGILTVQRTCFGCSFYEKKGKEHYCSLLKKDLVDHQIRIDCPEFVEKSN